MNHIIVLSSIQLVPSSIGTYLGRRQSMRLPKPTVKFVQYPYLK